MDAPPDGGMEGGEAVSGHVLDRAAAVLVLLACICAECIPALAGLTLAALACVGIKSAAFRVRSTKDGRAERIVTGPDSASSVAETKENVKGGSL